jgi:hypothetical protein
MLIGGSAARNEPPRHCSLHKERDYGKGTMAWPSSISPWRRRGVRCHLATECAHIAKLGRPDIIMFYGAAQAAFTQFPVQALAVLTAMYGPAVRCKRFWSRCRLAVLHQCIRPLIGARHAPGHDGNQRACDLISGQASCWAIWVTSVRMRREDRTSISFHPLADLGG